jgi:RNA polymerase sigma factor (sigma-70 family)
MQVVRMTDMDLLRRYAQTGDQQAFADLVARHVDVVYSAARRQTRGDASLAEEVTQQVFILLAQKAKSLPQGVLLGGWLFNTVRFVARDALRKQQRREAHEQKAAEMAEQVRAASAAASAGAKSGAWADAEGVLDEAMAQMPESTRGLIVLKFFEGKTAREVGEVLGISEEAARKRVSRAVDDLRELFARRGVVMSAAFLAEALALHAVIKAPPALAGMAASAAMSSAAAAKGTAVTTLLGAAKAKLVAMTAASLVVVGGTVAGGVQLVRYLHAPAGERTVTLNVSAPILTGTVVDPDGTPHVGDFIIATRGATINAYPPPGAARFTKSDGGKYSFPKPAGPFTVVARCDGGYAEVSDVALAKDPQVRMQPWGRIDGVLMSGTQPRANTPVRLLRIDDGDMEHANLVSHDVTTRTDANGRFSFERVAPGETWIMEQASAADADGRRCDYVVVAPGETATVRIGGSGRPVTGRIASRPAGVPSSVRWPGETGASFNATLRRLTVPMRSWPTMDPSDTPESFRAKHEAFGRTPDGHEQKKWMLGWSIAPEADGTFRMPDVPPGVYSINAFVTEIDSAVNYGQTVARGEWKVVVPEASADARVNLSPIDAGTVPMESLPVLRRSDVAPDFEMVAADGSHTRLSDFRGRHVLLALWYNFGRQDPQANETARIAAITSKWKGDPRLVVLRVRGDGNSTDLADAAKRNGITGNVLAPVDTQLPSPYRTSPGTAILIDPAGKVIQPNLYQKHIDNFDNRAMKQQPATGLKN